MITLLLALSLAQTGIAPLSDPAIQDYPLKQVAAMCSLSGERVSSQFKTCSYRCDDGGSFGLTVTKRETCPFVLNR
ncbi:hypothetical protein [Pararhizobium sp.]|uniref:hypothetical protein n=1 Tax=Pararhizobium sp. TaxID=1977563 RepID=UPI002723C084|nr:hypothetical protein [Pararhizobium sp.]MDO9417515.1 hypothetical protein [Pararhizobium sp.]